MECERWDATVVESALANIDVLVLLATFLEADELCQVRATCKALGSKELVAFDGLSMTEEAARRIFESASDEEKGTLPRHDGEGWIELYRHLLMLRASLTFDQLVGCRVSYQAGDKATVRLKGRFFSGRSSAICGNHVMRAGKHWATFVCDETSLLGSLSVGVIRPLPGWDHRALEEFHPSHSSFREDLRRERTGRWEGNVHFCYFYYSTANCYYSNWEGANQRSHWEGAENYDKGIDTLGMLLDLDCGTLSVYQDGRKVGTLKDGLAGMYCWIACFNRSGSALIKRGYNRNPPTVSVAIGQEPHTNH